MFRKGFTLMEIITALVIIGVLAVIALPMYQNTIEDGKTRQCEQNLQILKSSLDAYVIERNVVPGSLSQIPQEYVNNAYAKLISEQPDTWQLKLARFLNKLENNGIAYASFITNLVPGNVAVKCPSVKDMSNSYGLNTAIVVPGIDAAQYQSNIATFDSGIPIIADSSSSTFNWASNPQSIPSAIQKRHKKYGIIANSGNTYANGINRTGKLKIYSISNNSPSDNNGLPGTNNCQGLSTAEALLCWIHNLLGLLFGH